jgi:hypothetical protein
MTRNAITGSDARTPDLPTGTPSEADRQRQQETGFNHYYVKPVNM